MSIINVDSLKNKQCLNFFFPNIMIIFMIYNFQESKLKDR